MLGYFWRPDVADWPMSGPLPNERVAGEFNATDGRPWSLELLGSIIPPDEPPFSNPNEPPPRYDVLYGASSDQTGLSLFDAWRSSFTLFSALHDKETWRIGWYTAGRAWLEPDDEIDLIQIEYDLLTDWAWPYQHTASGYDRQNQEFRVPPTQTITVEVCGAKIVLHLGWNQTLSAKTYIAQTEATIEIHNNLALDKLRDNWILPLQDLLEFLTLKYVDIKRVTAKPTEIDAQVTVHYNVNKPSDIDDRSDQGIHPVTMLATRAALTDLGLDLQTLLQNYFMLIADENHKAALWFLSESSQRLLDKTVDTSLLNAFRALERYHDAAIDGTAIPEEEHTARVTLIIEGSPSEHQQWVRDQIFGANKKGLRRQLHEVLERATSTEAKIVEAWPGFFDSIVALRSKVAHGIPATGGDTVLRYLATATGLRWILRHVYLKELGLSDHDAAETISQCIPFEQELGLLRDWYQQLEQP